MRKEKKSPNDADVLKAAQEEVYASEIKYRRLFETAKDGILILDAESGRITDINPFLTDLLGYSRDQMIGKQIWEIGYFRDIASNRDNFLELKRKKYIRYEDLPLESTDGRRIDVEFVSNVYEQDHQSVIQCNIRDITARKRAADIIATERERLAVTLRSIGDGIIATDVQGRIELMNAVAEELCGWELPEAQGKPLGSVFTIIDENTRQPCENPVGQALATGTTIELANHRVVISKDGGERLIADSAAPIRNRQNQITGAVLVFRDITEKQKLIEIGHRNQQLESLGLLAGGIAHDFNNLLGGIYGYIDLAKEESKSDKTVHLLAKAMNTIDRARDLTRQLLTFAKGGNPLQAATEVGPLMREAAHFALSGSNVNPSFDLPEDLWMCNIDKNQISQVIDNIVINAKQSMPAGGAIRITAGNVSLKEAEHPILGKGRYVRITIRDSGIGISKIMQPHIFDPFFTTKDKGHGLGLSICYSIIKHHGGAIDVESELAVGSAFHIFLPAAAGRPVPKAAPVVMHRGGGRVLVMDDEEVLRDTFGHMLASFGYTVECKNDGQTALEFFLAERTARRPFAALVLDLTVPGGTGGKEVVREIRKVDPDIPVFVASGYADDPIMRSPAAYGFTASICKPFRKIELSEIFKKHLKT